MAKKREKKRKKKSKKRKKRRRKDSSSSSGGSDSEEEDEEETKRRKIKEVGPLVRSVTQIGDHTAGGPLVATSCRVTADRITRSFEGRRQTQSFYLGQRSRLGHILSSVIRSEYTSIISLSFIM